LLTEAVRTMHAVQARRERQLTVNDERDALMNKGPGGKEEPTAKEQDYLMKRGEHVRNWKKRLFVLQDTKLRWFGSDKDLATGRCLGEIVIVAHCDGVHGNKILTIQAAAGRQLLVRSDLGGQALLKTIRSRTRRVGPDMIMRIDNTRMSERVNVLEGAKLSPAKSEQPAKPAERTSVKAVTLNAPEKKESPKAATAPPAVPPPFLSKDDGQGHSGGKSMIDAMINLHKKAAGQASLRASRASLRASEIASARRSAASMTSEVEFTVQDEDEACGDDGAVDVSDGGSLTRLGGEKDDEAERVARVVVNARVSMDDAAHTIEAAADVDRMSAATYAANEEAERMRSEMAKMEKKLASMQLQLKESEAAKAEEAERVAAAQA